MDAQSGGIEQTAGDARKPRQKALGTNKLTDRTVRAFLAHLRAGKANTKKLADGGGLYITTTPNGTAVWRLKYRFAGKERLYAVGVFPDVSLEQARAQREMVKAHLREGKDPLQ